MANIDIRERAMKAGVHHWKIAEELKMRDNHFSRMLRHELSPEMKEKIFSIIDRLKMKQEETA